MRKTAVNPQRLYTRHILLSDVQFPPCMHARAITAHRQEEEEEDSL